MEIDIRDLLSNSLLEYCEFYTEEDECTVDSFLLAALDSYKRQYATAPAQPIEQPHPQSTFTRPTPNFTFRCSCVRQRCCESTSEKCPQENSRRHQVLRQPVGRMAQLPSTAH